MSTETSKAQDEVSASLTANKGSTERVGAGGVYTVTCVGAMALKSGLTPSTTWL